MKIDGIGGRNEPYPVSKSKDSAATPPSAKTSASDGGDRLELSADAKRISRLAQAAQGLPEIRRERVAELAQAIRRGVHEVEPRALARSILEFEDALR